MSAVQTNGTQTAELPQDVRVVLVGIDEIAQTPETSNSRVDIGRAMILVSAPDEDLPDLIERARSLSQQDLAVQVAAKRRTCVQAASKTSADERRALSAHQALLLVQHVPDPVRQALVCVQQRLNELLA